MARTQIGSQWGGNSGSTASTYNAPSRSITAGSVVIYRWRYEGGAANLSTFSDGTAASWTTLEYGSQPTVGYAVCLNHPGGSTTGSLQLSAARVEFTLFGVELTGGSATIDAAPAGVTGTTPSISYTATGDGTAFAVTGYFSASGLTPTSPATSDSFGAVYAEGWRLNDTGSGSKSMAGAGGSGNTVSLAVVIKDAVVAPTITGPSGKQMTGGFFDLSGGTN